MTKHPDQIWCDVHGSIHEPVTNPFEGPANEHDKNGKPVWLEHIEVYEDDGSDVFYGLRGDYSRAVTTVIRPMEPECTNEDWKLLWIGKNVAAPLMTSKSYLAQSQPRKT